MFGTSGALRRSKTQRLLLLSESRLLALDKGGGKRRVARHKKLRALARSLTGDMRKRRKKHPSLVEKLSNKIRSFGGEYAVQVPFMKLPCQVPRYP
jgi:hypothetical protein